MAQTPQERKRNSEESAKVQALVAKQWVQFSKTEAYKQFRDYIELQDYFATTAAKGPVNTFEGQDGAQLDFDPIKAANLLQRSVGYDIVKLYMDGYISPDML